MRPTIYFYSSQQYKEPETFVFSQFHKAPFKTGGKTYWCNEQYYQARKAKVIEMYRCEKKQVQNDTETTCATLWKCIMKEQNSAMRIADMARDYVLEGAAKAEWAAQQKEVLYTANYCKFKQNFDQRAWLMRTGNAELVEASDKDRVCGIGFLRTTAEKNRHRWGDNLLGIAIERVRSELNQEIQQDYMKFLAGENDSKKHLDKKYRTDRKFAYTYNDKIPPVSQLSSLPRGAENKSKTPPPTSTNKPKDDKMTRPAVPVSGKSNNVVSTERSGKRKAADARKETVSTLERNTKQPKHESKNQSPDPPLRRLPPPTASVALSSTPIKKPPPSEARTTLEPSPPKRSGTSSSGPAKLPRPDTFVKPMLSKSTLTLPGNARGPTKTYGPLELTSPQLEKDRIRRRERVNNLIEADDLARETQRLFSATDAKRFGSSIQETNQPRNTPFSLLTAEAPPSNSASIGTISKERLDDTSGFEIDPDTIAAIGRDLDGMKARMTAEKELSWEFPAATFHEFDQGVKQLWGARLLRESKKMAK